MFSQSKQTYYQYYFINIWDICLCIENIVRTLSYVFDSKAIYQRIGARTRHSNQMTGQKYEAFCFLVVITKNFDLSIGQRGKNS